MCIRDRHGYDTFHGNGLRFQWRDEDGEVEGYVSWKDIEKELGVLILTGEYQPETPRIDELAMDGLREDDEVIDAEYREVEPEAVSYTHLGSGTGCRTGAVVTCSCSCHDCCSSYCGDSNPLQFSICFISATT